MKYLLDCGSAQFQGLQQLIDEQVVDSTFGVFCFEANPYTFSRAARKLPGMRRQLQSIHAMNAAIAPSNGMTPINCCSVTDDRFDRIASPHQRLMKRSQYQVKQFLKSKLGSKSYEAQGSTILASPPSQDGDHRFEFLTSIVPALTLPSIIASLDNCDSLLIKLDIEGAEFEVLENLIDRLPTIKHVPETIFIEWHERFFDNSAEILARKDRIIQNLTRHGIDLRPWH